MTLVEVIKVIEVIAARQPSVHMIIENDVFRLNEKADAKYGVFAWTQGQHSTRVEGNSIDFAFNFFYIDRLKNDRSNQLEIQSVGTQTLDNIIRTLDDIGIDIDNTYTFQVFNQRFADECAGVYVNVILSVPVNSICPEYFTDFSADDFNDDFNTFGTSEDIPLININGLPGQGGGYRPYPTNYLRYRYCETLEEYNSIPHDPGTLYLIRELQ